jgi:transposase
VCVIDETGKAVDRFTVGHDGEGLRGLVARLGRLCPADELAVAIERPSGIVVETLAAAGHPVVPIHPNALKATRPRYGEALAKSDGGDCYMLADLLRTDGHRFRPLHASSDELKALRALVRGREDLIEQRVALANQLRALLDGFWPGAAVVFADIASPIALAFLRRYPTPEGAARLGEKRLASFLAQESYCGRRSPAELLARLRAAAPGHPGEAEAEIKGELVRALADVLATVVDRLAKLTARLEHMVASLPDGRIFMSFPRAGRVCAAQILAEIGDDRARFPSEAQLAVEAGMCPVTKASGKSRAVSFRWACNKRLRAALSCFADNSRHASPWAADIYLRARARGCDHPHAIRILGRVWVRVLWRAWQDRVPYDPCRHRAARACTA